MTWLVFLMGLALALVGAWSVYTGAPIIRLEQGWAEVIAGSVAISSGIVTIALAVVVAQIGALRRLLRTEGLRPAVPVGGAPAVEPALVGLRPTHSPDEDVFVSALDDGPLPEPPLEEVPREPAPVRTEMDAPQAETHVVRGGEAPELAVTAPEPERAAPRVETVRALERSAPEVNEAQPRRLTAPSLDLAESERAPPVPSATISRDWLTRPLLRARTPQAAPEPLLFDPPEPAAADVGSHGPAPDAPATPSHEPRVEDAAEPARPEPDVLVTPEPETAAAAPSEPAVIGRYQSGASSYTMYSDGAIDVETDGGDIHRFASMEDLKAFIARQERALS